MESSSVTEITEDVLCRWLFLEPAARPLLEELRVLPGSRVWFSVPTTSVLSEARGPGDIDVLIGNPQYPESALAIEVKRVKVESATFHTGTPGKLQGLKHGVQQANLLAKVGFHRTFLLVAVVIDGRERVELNFASRGLTSELAKAIGEFPRRAALAAHVGLAFVEITQPVDRPITDAGGIGVRVAQQPTGIAQSPALTAGIVHLFSHGYGRG